jgi:glycosyltransferase involved in cell wall biosynthesis
MGSELRLCVLLPAYNEGKNVGRVVREILALDLPCKTTALVVDDGSKDDTAQVARDAGAHVLTHEVNRGVGAGFRTGVTWARNEGFDLMLHMDSDGQAPPREIPKLLAPVLAGEADVAIGTRFRGPFPENLALWKGLALTATARVVGLAAGYSISDLSCGFRCLNRRAMEVVEPSFDYDYIQETLIQVLAARLRVVDVQVDVLYERVPQKASMSTRTFRYGSRFLFLTGYSMAKLVQTRLRG